MRLRKIIKAASAASLGVSGLILLGGYAWLYGWKWGSAPAANSSMQAEEVRLLSALLGTCVETADRKLSRRPDRPFSRQELAALFAALLAE